MALHERYLEKVVPNTYGTTLTCCFCLGCERRTALSSTGGGGRGGRSGGSSYHSISQSVDMDSPPLLSNMEEGAANMSGGDGGKGGGGKRRVVVAAKGAVEEVNAAVQVRREGHWPCVCATTVCVQRGVYSVYSVSSCGIYYTHAYSRYEWLRNRYITMVHGYFPLISSFNIFSHNLPGRPSSV